MVFSLVFRASFTQEGWLITVTYQMTHKRPGIHKLVCYQHCCHHQYGNGALQYYLELSNDS